MESDAVSQGPRSCEDRIILHVDGVAANMGTSYILDESPWDPDVPDFDAAVPAARQEDFRPFGVEFHAENSHFVIVADRFFAAYVA